MNVEEILMKHLDEDGKINVEDAAKEIKEVQGKQFVPKEDFNSKNEELKTLKGTLEEMGNSTETNEELQSTIEALQGELTETKRNAKIDEALRNANSRNMKAIKALLNLDNVEFSEDGDIQGLDEQIESLKKSDAYLFESKKEPEVNISGATPGQSKTRKPGGNPDPRNMSYGEFQEWYNNQERGI